MIRKSTLAYYFAVITQLEKGDKTKEELMKKAGMSTVEWREFYKRMRARRLIGTVYGKPPKITLIRLAGEWS